MFLFKKASISSHTSDNISLNRIFFVQENFFAHCMVIVNVSAAIEQGAGNLQHVVSM